MIDFKAIRNKHVERIREQYSFDMKDDQPGIIEWDSKTAHSEETVIMRSAALQVVLAHRNGCPHELAIQNIEQNGLTPHLAPDEIDFLDLKDPKKDERLLREMNRREEAKWALGWALSLYDDRELEILSPDGLVE